MNMANTDNYEKLAYDLYREADNLIEKLVKIRKARSISITDLAREMSVDPDIIIGVENGSIEPTLQLILDYALEIGATIRIDVKQTPSDN